MGSQTVRRMRGEESGFTLIELLVVILILGVLAALALPVFLGWRAKAQDGDAKSNARNLVSEVEACYTRSQDYSDCDTVSELGNTGLSLVDGNPAVNSAQVGVEPGATSTAYAVRAESKSGNRFVITHSAGGSNTRSCVENTSEGGCSGTSW